MSGSSNRREEIGNQDKLKKHYAISAIGIEGLFMEWIVRALKPSGKAFVVVPDGIMNRSNDKKLRNFILDQCNINAVIPLPLNTFFTKNNEQFHGITGYFYDVTSGLDGLPQYVHCPYTDFFKINDQIVENGWGDLISFFIDLIDGNLLISPRKCL